MPTINLSCFDKWHVQCSCGPPRCESVVFRCSVCECTVYAHDPARITDAELAAMALYVKENEARSGNKGMIHWDVFLERVSPPSVRLPCFAERLCSM